MRAPARTLLSGALLALACSAGPAAAQESTPAGAPERAVSSAAAADSAPRIGLALSGGSARGFAHVGVLRALERMDVPVDMVAGVSMGAVVGGLYAVGYEPEELERLAVDGDWRALFFESEPPGIGRAGIAAPAERHVLSFPLRSGRPTLPSGLVTGQRITQLLTRLTWHVHPTDDFRRLPLPFVAVATDLETGEPVPLERGSLPLALRASLAIPSLFTPVRLQGRHLVDGGVSRNLPAEDVRRLGADVVICSDVTEPLEPADSLGTFLDVLTQTVSFRTVREVERQRAQCDVLIRPELEGPGSYAFGRADTWIRRGDSAASAARDTLRALAARAGPVRRRPGRPDLSPGGDSVFVAEVRFPDLSPARARYLRRLMGVGARGATTVGRIDREIGRLYDSGLFARVVYRLDEPPDGTGGRLPRRTLVVETDPAGRRDLRAGLRFDSHRQAAVLFTLDLPRTPGFGSAARLDARLGEQLHLEARQHVRPPFATGFLAEVRAAYRRTPLELSAPAGPSLEATPEEVRGGVLLGNVIGRQGLVGIEGGIEWFEVDTDEGVPPPEPAGQLTTLAALATWDSRDRIAFTRSGIRVDLSVEAAAEIGGENRDLVQSWGDLELHVPVGDRWTLSARATAGTTSGSAPPLHRTFFLGGAVPDRVAPRRRLTLPGLAPNALRGEELRRAETGLRAKVGSDLYLSAAWTGGAVGDDGTLGLSGWTHGFALGAGIRTPLGPVRLVAADVVGSEGPRLALDAGGQF